MRRGIRRAVCLATLGGAGLAVAFAACDFEAVNHPAGSDGDAGTVFDSMPDAEIRPPDPCQVVPSATCVGNGERLRACKNVGQLPEETICTFGCVDAPTAHCQLIKPSGGAVTAADLDPAGEMVANLDEKTFTATGQTISFNSDTGEIKNGGGTLRGAGMGIISGIDFQVRAGVGIFRFKKLHLAGQPLRGIGTNALAMVSITTIDVDTLANFSLQGTCDGTSAGPGGSPGGAAQTAGLGLGAGLAGAANGATCSGGGGAGYGEAGGNGGRNNNSGGAPSGMATIPALVGGAGGGGGGGGNAGSGGGGGGALQLVANDRIHIAGGMFTAVAINAGGCGGNAGAANNCGGGGGAGGTLLFEAARVDIENAYVVANGGGGGGASAGGNGGDGDTNQQARGGTAGNPTTSQGDRGGAGGNGGRGDGFRNNDTAGGGLEDDSRGGGGGGGAGRIRLNTKSGSIGQSNSTISPGSGESNATSVGTVTLQ